MIKNFNVFVLVIRKKPDNNTGSTEAKNQLALLASTKLEENNKKHNIERKYEL
jgi:hypothetical protein